MLGAYCAAGLTPGVGTYYLARFEMSDLKVEIDDMVSKLTEMTFEQSASSRLDELYGTDPVQSAPGAAMY